MRQSGSGAASGQRSSALWGKGSGGQSRGSALWGKGGRSGIALLALVVTIVIPAAGFAGEKRQALVAPELLAKAEASPDASFSVIVQGKHGARGDDVASAVRANGGELKRSLRSVGGAAVAVTGKELLKLARHPNVYAVTEDTRLRVAYESAEMWRLSVGVARLWGGPQTPAIAIVDSGIDSTRADFGSRVVARVNFSSLAPGATGDRLGHGTMVAGLAAGGGTPLLGFFRGAAPSSPLVDVRVTDDRGEALTSDIVAAIDWIIANKDRLNIGVANFSLSGTSESSMLFDPMNRAVQKLWLSGVVVVAAAGNHGSGSGPVKLSSPANDPFVITVGATDLRKTTDVSDDVRAPWSAFGHTADGFAKPELGAPGRYMISAVPLGSVLATTRPERVVSSLGYMWMSGTSFAAPIVAGSAAQILARNPGFTPDQVKGALMLTATHLPSQGLGLGVGQVNAQAAAGVSAPPNPNENLYQFVSNGEFDPMAWAAHVSVNANWTQANWVSANWTAANWVSSNWVSANWTASNWVSSNWVSSNWTASNWVSSNWVSSFGDE